MLNLPIYFFGASYYLHTRINGKQVKKSLRTSYKRVAIIRAIDLLTTMHKKPDLSNLSTYELDISRGVAKSDGPDDHARMMDAIAALKALHSGQPMQTISVQASAALADDPTALKLDEFLEKFFLLKSVQYGTVKSYRATASELAKFLKNPPITRITGSDITRFQEHLAKKGNVPRTIGNKTDAIRSILNFAKIQGYTRGDNPAANRSLQSKAQRKKSGWATFETEEITAFLSSDFFRERREQNPDYTNSVLMGLFTGCRVGEITALKKDNFKRSRNETPYIAIRDSKTHAGIREVPIHPFMFAQIAPMLDGLKTPSAKLFKYKERDGKGSGNAPGKMFARNLNLAGVARKKLVFHSLRKYLNNELMQNGVNLEHRCQFVGHEVDNVNVAIYTKTIGVDELAASVFPTLDTIAELVKKAFDPMNGIELGELIDPDMLM